VALAAGLVGACATQPATDRSATPTRTAETDPGADGDAVAPWDLDTDIPCAATDPDTFAKALHARMRSRVQLPPGFRFRARGAKRRGDVQVVVGLELQPDGKIMMARPHPSGVPALDQAVQAALEKATCMPPPPPALLNPRSGTFQIIMLYGFDRANER
jgi:TonB family protein